MWLLVLQLNSYSLTPVIVVIPDRVDLRWTKRQAHFLAISAGFTLLSLHYLQCNTARNVSDQVHFANQGWIIQPWSSSDPERVNCAVYVRP
jgi:hypothetical protein